MSADTLSYDEQLFLLAFQSFLNRKYQLDSKNRSADQISRDHIQAQKIGYFLNSIRLLPNYCFNWNQRGPFSARFQGLLSDLDAKSEAVQEFYNSHSPDEINKLLPECLSSQLSILKGSISTFLNQERDKTKDQNTTRFDEQVFLTDNLELLGSLLYVAKTVIPGQDYSYISKELTNRKASFCDEDKNLRAWNCLLDTKLISSL